MKIIGARGWIPNIKDLQSLLPFKDWKSKGMYESTILSIKLHIATSSNLLPVVVTFSSLEQAKGSIIVDALLDNGCFAGGFVARRIVDKYNIKPILQSLDNTCYDISKSVIISVHYFNERLDNVNTFEINVIILDSSPLDLIIGRTTIKKFGFVHQDPSQFKNIGKMLIIEANSSEHATKCRGCQPKEKLQTSRSVSKGSPDIPIGETDSIPNITHTSVISSRVCTTLESTSL